jgi:hypothetical protein
VWHKNQGDFRNILTNLALIFTFFRPNMFRIDFFCLQIVPTVIFSLKNKGETNFSVVFFGQNNRLDAKLEQEIKN